MARDVPSTLQTELSGDAPIPVLFAKFLFDSGDVNFWNGLGEKTFLGDIYLGAGDLGGVTPVQETKRFRANGVSFVLSGVPPSVLAIALQENYRGRKVKLWLAALEDGTLSVIESYLLFSGFMDTMVIEELGEKVTIVLNAENKLIELERARRLRWTPEEQATIWGEGKDDIFSEVTKLNSGVEVVWEAAA